jgi:hypothetical protein
METAPSHLSFTVNAQRTMLTLAALLATLVSPSQVGPLATADTIATRVAVVATPSPADSIGGLFQHVSLGVSDTTRHRRPRAVELSDAAIMRLRIHRYLAYTTIPLFAVQAIAGNQLYQADKNGEPRPDWAENTHKIGAATVATVFGVNTITGVWALWDQRANPEGRTRRWVHSLLMLASDGGFAWSGIKLSQDAKNSQSSRNQHKNVAYASMGTALVSYGIMFFGNR